MMESQKVNERWNRRDQKQKQIEEYQNRVEFAKIVQYKQKQRWNRRDEKRKRIDEYQNRVEFAEPEEFCEFD